MASESSAPLTDERKLIFVSENPGAGGDEQIHLARESHATKTYRRLQVQVVHRHGDRSPITPLKDEEYWAQQLIPESRLQEIARNTTILSDGVVNTHKANGRGAFGKLTNLGLEQMVNLGALLRRELSSKVRNESKIDAQGNIVYPYIWTPDRPLQPSNIRVVSTSFERAIQSAQGVLQGLFPDGWADGETIEIDARHTSIMLPDPQPRRTQEQVDLEDTLAARPHLEESEKQMLPLAVRVTQALHPLLAADAHEACFGAKQLRHGSAESIEVEPLAWNQLAELTKCFACRDGMLAAVGISHEDHQAVVQHAAWRWFETFRHPRLAYLGMHEQCTKMVDSFCRTTNQQEEDAAPMTLYSAHDSTLIGLLCAFKLEQPVAWPEYGSFLMMELLEVEVSESTRENDAPAASNKKKDLYVRFSLSGELLRSMWDEGEPSDMILLDRLAEKLRNEGKATAGMTS